MVPAGRTLTAEEIATYHRDGVVALRDVVPVGWVDDLRVAMQEVFDRDDDVGRDAYASGASRSGARGEMVGIMQDLLERADPATLAIEQGHTPAGRSIVETDACSWHEGLRNLHISGPLPPIVAALTGSSRVNLYSDQLFLKEPGSSVRTPWHQDQPFWVLQGTKVAVCWVPVDRVTVDSGAMGYVRGSHRWGVTYKPSDFVTMTGSSRIPGLRFDGLTDLPPIDADPAAYDIVRFEAGPGDVIVHHWKTLHGSTGNVSADRMRRAASVRFAGDDVTFYLRPSSPEPFRHTVGLSDGDDLDGAARFPRVWPRA
ncbi:MAG: phytanoyl-CoA dioxygenase family protein [Acidimicrobiales bacterium]